MGPTNSKTNFLLLTLLPPKAQIFEVLSERAGKFPLSQKHIHCSRGPLGVVQDMCVPIVGRALCWPPRRVPQPTRLDPSPPPLLGQPFHCVC